MKTESNNTSFEIWRLFTSIYRKWYREAEKRLINNGISIMEYRTSMSECSMKLIVLDMNSS